MVATSSKSFNMGLEAENPFASIQLSDPQTPQSAYESAEADVLGLLFQERIVFLGSGINDYVADAVIGQLLLLDAQDPTKDIKLFINSSGGDVYSTLAIFDAIQYVRADISTIAIGVAISTASLLLGGGTRGKRLSMPNSRIMVHQPYGGASGTVHDLEIQSKEVRANKQTVINILSDITGRPLEQVEKDIFKDRFMSPVEAIEFGLIDGVIDKDRIIPLSPIPELERDGNFDFEDFSVEVPDEDIY